MIAFSRHFLWEDLMHSLCTALKNILFSLCTPCATLIHIAPPSYLILPSFNLSTPLYFRYIHYSSSFFTLSRPFLHFSTSYFPDPSYTLYTPILDQFFLLVVQFLYTSLLNSMNAPSTPLQLS